MTRDEIKAALTLCFVNYPRHYQGMSDTEKRVLVDTWERQFKDIPSQAFRHILDRHLQTSKFAPTIADLHEQLSLVTDSTTDSELWNECIRMLRRGTVMTQDEFDKASAPVKAWLRDLRSVRELALMDATTVNTVVRGQFLKTIGQVQKSIKARQAIPGEVLEQIQTTMNNARLLGQEEEEWT